MNEKSATNQKLETKNNKEIFKNKIKSTFFSYNGLSNTLIQIGFKEKNLKFLQIYNTFSIIIYKFDFYQLIKIRNLLYIYNKVDRNGTYILCLL